jgi:hypothetical protein
MLGNGHLKGFWNSYMSWDILGSNTFWLQMNLSIHGWMRVYTYVSDLEK